MNTLKEQDGRYYQECNVVMLTTNYASLTLFKDNNQISLARGNHYGLPNIVPQHLYITSDEEIKEKDWILFQFGSDLVEQVTKILPNGDIIVGENNHRHPNFCKKIIATTDETLWLCDETVPYPKTNKLPKPSDSFISKYIEEYNVDNQITDVLVEYDDNGEEDWFGDTYTGESFWNSKFELKVDSNNTITIKKVKDSYSREEVEKLVINALKTRVVWQSEVDKWIKENL